jgi:hypothetical protein
MAKFIHQHLKVLELTEQTKTLFNKNSLFVSYEMEKNILGMTTCDKFKEEPSPSGTSPSGITSVSVENPTSIPLEDPTWGSHSCPKTNTLCKNFLQISRTFTSPKTSQIFKIKSHINCTTKNVIYLIY